MRTRTTLGTLMICGALLAVGGCGNDPASTTPMPAPPELPVIPDEHLSASLREVLDEALAAVRAEPRDPGRWLALGQFLHAHQLDDAAIQCYEAVEGLGPLIAQAPYLHALLASKRGDYEEARSLYARTNTLVENSGGTGYPPAELGAARDLVQLGRIEEAREELTRVVELYDAYEGARLELANVLALLGLANDALVQLEWLHDRFPEDRASTAALARVYGMLGHQDQALDMSALSQTLTDVLPQRDPFRLEMLAHASGLAARIERARRYMETGQLDACIAELRSVVRLRADDPAVLDLLGEALLEAEQHAEAFELYERVVALAPDGRRFLVRGARAALGVRRPDRAVTWARQALELRDTESARRLLARAQVLDQDPAAGLETFKTISKLEVDDYMLRGQARTTLGRLTEAEADFRAALESVPEFGPAHYQLGAVLQLQDRAQEALAAFERAEELAPALPAEVRIDALRGALGLR